MSPPLTACVAAEGHTAKIMLAGHFDFNAHRDFRQACDDALALSGIRELLLDFEKVDYIDSSALGMLLLLREKSSNADISVVLLHCSGTVRQVLDVACFGKLFTIR